MNYTPHTKFVNDTHPAGLQILPGEQDDTRAKILRLAVNGISRSGASQRVGISHNKASRVMTSMVDSGELRIDEQIHAATNRPVQMYFRNERVIQ